MIILIGSEKGGVGKSTLATNLAVLLVSSGKDVVILDADRQSTCANWAQDRSESSKKVNVDCIRQYDNLKPTLESLKSRYEIIIVDCQGRISQEMRTGLLSSDLVVIPFKPSQWDLDTLPSMLNIIKEAKDFNPNLISCAVMTMAPTNPNMDDLNQARNFFDNYPDITLLNTAICERKVYKEAAGLGLSVIELDNKKATDEINGVLTELLNIEKNNE
jgi:chromosome partitioning protein